MASIKHKSQEKCMNIISDLLKREDNKYCVDCGSRGPRWASCTLGVFLCIQCAIIHRNMGVHLSRIKSVDYDFWDFQQVNTMVKIGNSRGRAIYEANLGNNFLRPQNKDELVEFIRSKYEFKLYVKKEQNSPTATPEERRLKQNPNDKKVNSKIILSKQENIVIPISVKIIKECDSGSATKPLTVSSSVSNNTLINNIDRVTNSSTLSNNNGPTNNIMNHRKNSVFPGPPEMPQKSDVVAADDDDDDEFTDFISATQPPIITEPLLVSSSINDVDAVFNSSNNNASTYQNNLTNFNFELERYAMNGNMSPGQRNTNNVFGVQHHQFTNNSEFPTQPSMHVSQESDDATNSVDDFPEFISTPQPPMSNYQTSNDSATQSITENNSAIGSVSNSATLPSVNAPVIQNNLVQFNFQSEVYAMNENNFMIHEQLYANNAFGVPWHQSFNNSLFPGQPIIPISQVIQYNLLQITSLENQDSNVHVSIPESGNEFSTAYPETGTDNYLEFLENIEVTELFQILLL